MTGHLFPVVIQLLAANTGLDATLGQPVGDTFEQALDLGVAEGVPLHRADGLDPLEIARCLGLRRREAVDGVAW